MRSVGIVCECNPLHEGHRYLIRRAREDGADCVICVMSGCFTQRGEAAILDPRTRAAMLLDGGADAVLELPFPYSCGGAEAFAEAGVSMLARLGIGELWFGSECGDLPLLERLARAAESRAFAERYREACRGERVGTAEAFGQILSDLCGGVETGPNDRLAIAYLKALRHTDMTPHTVRRLGSGYFDETAVEGQIPSATALRRLLNEGGLEAWKPYLTDNGYALVAECVGKEIAPADTARLGTAALAHLRLASPETLESVAELGGGLGRRMIGAAERAEGFSELLSLSVTKKYTEARVRRGILFAMTGVTEADLKAPVGYGVLLAANPTGCAFLGKTRRTGDLKVVTSHRGIPKGELAARQELLTRRAWALYTLCLPRVRSAESFLRKSSLIVDRI